MLAESDSLQETYLKAVREQYELKKSGHDTSAIDQMVIKLESVKKEQERAAGRAAVKEQADREMATLQTISHDIEKFSIDITKCTDPTEVQELKKKISSLEEQKIRWWNSKLEGNDIWSE